MQSGSSPSSLPEILKASRKALTSVLIKNVRQRQQQIENNVYSLQTNDCASHLQYLNGVSSRLKPQLQLALGNILDIKVRSVQRDIENGQLKLPKKQSLPPSQMKEMLRNRQRQLSLKLEGLRSSFNESSILTTNTLLDERLEVLNPNYYSINHPRTKQAIEFTRKMNIVEKSLRNRRELMLQRKQQSLELEQEAQRQCESREIRQRRRRLEQQIEQRRRLKEKELLEKNSKLQRINAMLMQIKGETPLFVKKEEQFIENVVKPSQNQYELKLQEIRQARQPIDREQLDRHDKRYSDFLLDNQLRKQSQKEAEESNNRSKKYYRGRFRYYVLQAIERQKEQQDVTLTQRIKKAKEKMYAEYVREKFGPRRKRYELVEEAEYREYPQQLQQVDSRQIQADQSSQLQKHIEQQPMLKSARQSQAPVARVPEVAISARETSSRNDPLNQPYEQPSVRSSDDSF